MGQLCIAYAPVNVHPQGAPLATQGILTANVLPTQGTLTQISVDRVGMSDKSNAPVSVNPGDSDS